MAGAARVLSDTSIRPINDGFTPILRRKILERMKPSESMTNTDELGNWIAGSVPGNDVRSTGVGLV